MIPNACELAATLAAHPPVARGMSRLSPRFYCRRVARQLHINFMCIYASLRYGWLMRTDHPSYRLFTAEECTFLERMFVQHPGIGNRFDTFLGIAPEERYSHAIRALQFMPRKGWVRRFVKNPETVYDHLIDLTKMTQACTLPEDLGGLTVDKARRKLMVMASLHDVPEAIATDFTPHCAIDPEDKDQLELLAGKVIFASDSHRMKRLQEYVEQVTPLSHTLHDLDKLSAVRQALVYEGQYPEKRGKLYEEFRTHAQPCLKTDAGRQLAAEIDAQAEAIREEGRQKSLKEKFGGRAR